MNDKIVELYIKHQVVTTKVKFGWNEDITEYQYIRFFDHKDVGYIMIECRYMDSGRSLSKHITVNKSDVLQFVRDNKLSELGI